MCYAVLPREDVTDRSLRSLLGAELTMALRNGAAVAAVVVAALLGTLSTVGLAGAAIGALVLGALVHETIIATGVVALRLSDRSGTPDGRVA